MICDRKHFPIKFTYLSVNVWRSQPQVFAHRGNLLRHMALHDPENPGNKELLAEAEEADQTEGYEEEEIGLEAPGQIIQTVWDHHQILFITVHV